MKHDIKGARLAFLQQLRQANVVCHAEIGQNSVNYGLAARQQLAGGRRHHEAVERRVCVAGAVVVARVGRQVRHDRLVDADGRPHFVREQVRRGNRQPAEAVRRGAEAYGVGARARGLDDPGDLR